MIPKAEIFPSKAIRITRNNITSRAYYINEVKSHLTIFDCSTLESRRKLILLIIEFLNVENSLRYRKEQQKTYCNIYAVEVAHLIGAYIPRVWWTGDAITSIKQGQCIKAEYGKSVTELNSNGLFEWFETYGHLFRWNKVQKWDHLSSIVKENGTIGIVVSKGNTSQENGHICIVYYKNMLFRKIWLSEAGRINSEKMFSRWWNKFDNYGFWYLSLSNEQVT
jgi:hypothetical protein